MRFYEGYVSRFIGYVTEPVLQIPRGMVAAFLDTLTCTPAGKHAYFRAIRAFYRWAFDEELVDKTPIDRVKPPKVPKPLRYAVPVEALDKLLANCQTLRDKVAVSLLADTGLRRGELCGIRPCDINLPDCIIKVWGKGAKQRVVRYGPITARLLERYLSEHEPGDTLLGIKVDGFQDMLKRLGDKTGIKCNAHAFRRTFACESVRNGVNLFHVQSLLGHESLTMTRIYAEQVGSEDAIKAYKPIVT